MVKVSIVGATGYVGIELLRLLNGHPGVEVQYLISRGNAGKRLIDVYPQFSGSRYKDYEFVDYADVQLTDSDLVFTALPHGVSQEMVADIYRQGVRVIDMSGDFRYKDINIYQSWYNIEHKFPELAEQAVYGLVELNRKKIRTAGIVANPGCYVTASLLGLLPLVDGEMEIINSNSIIIDAKSGVSGAGKSLKRSLLFNETYNSLKAYNVTTHRHTSEIEYILNKVYKENTKKNSKKNSADKDNSYIHKKNNCGEELKDFNLIFTPHLIPVKRGILATIYADIVVDIDEIGLKDIYRDYYQGDQFVQLLESDLPEIKYVVGSNYCHLGLKYDQRTGKVIVVSTIDNLIKGSAGQAVQNMNLMFDLKENTGLEATAMFP